MAQHRGLEVAHLAGRLDPDVVGEASPMLVVHPQRLDLASGPVEGQHPHRRQPLAQWMGRGQLGERPDDLGVAAPRQLAIEPRLGRDQPQLVEAGTLGHHERDAGQVGEQLAAPERQRGVVLLGRDEAFEASRVEVVVVDGEHVPAPARAQDGVRERLAQLRHVLLERLGGRGRGPSLPHVVDQPLRGNDPAGVEEQASQDGPLAEPAQWDPSGLVVHLQRPEDGELHHAPPSTP